MAAITPKNQADEAILDNLRIGYNIKWSGSAWVLTGGDVTIIGSGWLALDDVKTQEATIELLGTDLPAAGQTALQQLRDFIEAELATKYG